MKQKDKNLTTLIRIHQNELDNLQLLISEILQRQEKLQEQHNRLSNDLKQERELSMSDPESIKFFASYAKRVQDKQKEIESLNNKLEQEADEVRAAITAHYSELKKYDLTLEKLTNERIEEERLNEQKLYDDMASTYYINKNRT